MKKVIFLILLALQLHIASSLFAECIPTVDGCTPAKDPSAWDKSLAFGLNVTSGNSETTLVNIGGKVARDFENNIWDFGVAYNYGEDKAREETNQDKTSRNDFRGNASYNRLLDERVFVGLGSKVFYDEIADIDYRVNVDPTAGYYFLKDNSFKFRGEAGPSYIFERVGAVDNDYLAPRVADKFEWFITCTSKLFQSAEVLFDVNDGDNYLVNAEVGLESALTTSLSLVFTVRETYDNVPAEGKEKDDLALITALKVTL